MQEKVFCFTKHFRQGKQANCKTLGVKTRQVFYSKIKTGSLRDFPFVSSNLAFDINEKV